MSGFLGALATTCTHTHTLLLDRRTFRSFWDKADLHAYTVPAKVIPLSPMCVRVFMLRFRSSSHSEWLCSHRRTRKRARLFRSSPTSLVFLPTSNPTFLLCDCRFLSPTSFLLLVHTSIHRPLRSIPAKRWRGARFCISGVLHTCALVLALPLTAWSAQPN